MAIIKMKTERKREVPAVITSIMQQQKQHSGKALVAKVILLNLPNWLELVSAKVELLLPLHYCYY